MARDTWITSMTDEELLNTIEQCEEDAEKPSMVSCMGECFVGGPKPLPQYFNTLIAEAQSRGLLPTPDVQASEPAGESK